MSEMSETDTASATQALATQLSTPAGESKKFKMVQRGMIYVVATYALSVIAMIFKPQLAVNISGPLTVVIAALGGLVSVYTGSQAAVDWRTTAALSK